MKCVRSCLLGLIFSASPALAGYSEISERLTDKYGDFKDYGDNAGVVIMNSSHQIYRSEKLGKKDMSELFTFLRRKGLPVPKTVIYMNNDGYNDGGFALEEDDMQDVLGYTFYHSFGPDDLRTYLDGHNPLQPKEDIDVDNKHLGKEAKRRYLPIANSRGKDGGIEAFERILGLVLAEENQPVLFHCLGGIHRTGMVAMALRYMQGGKYLRNDKGQVSSKDNFAHKEYRHFAGIIGRSENIDFINRVFYPDRRTGQVYYQHLIDQYRATLNAR